MQTRRRYVQSGNPRGHRQATASHKALEIRSERPHSHVVKAVTLTPPTQSKHFLLEMVYEPRQLNEGPLPKGAPVFSIPAELWHYIATPSARSECMV